MSRWILVLRSSAENDLARLDKSARRRMLDKLEWLESNFDDVLPQPLSNELSRFYKLRVGDWRIIYTVKDKEKEVAVVAIDHRSKIYERNL